jgi:hypothetical protein
MTERITAPRVGRIGGPSRTVVRGSDAVAVPEATTMSKTSSRDETILSLASADATAASSNTEDRRAARSALTEAIPFRHVIRGDT